MFFGLIIVLSLIPLIRLGAFTLTFKELLLYDPILPILAFNTLWFGGVGLILCQSGLPSLRLLRLQPLQTLGLISYGVYLYHYLIQIMTTQAATAGLIFWNPPIWVDGLRLSACIGVAYLSWIYIEQPILRLKDRFSYSSVSTRQPHCFRPNPSQPSKPGWQSR